MYGRNEGTELAALAEVDPELLATRGDEWGVDGNARYESYEAMLDEEDLDIVSVSTPSSFHHEPVLATTESRADPDVVFCEKPAANSPREAYEMAEACADAGMELVVDHTLRFSKAFTALRRLLQEERVVGDLQSVHINASGSLMRLGTHYVDLLQFLVDAEPVEIRGGYLSRDGTGDEYDDRDGGATVVFDDGTVAMLDETRSSGVAHLHSYVGTDGMIAGRGSDTSSIYSREFEWRYWGIEDREHVEAELPEPLEEYWSRDMSENTSGFDADAGMYGAQRIFDNVADHLVALLDGEEENRSPGRDAAKVIEILSSIFVSHETGSNVALPLSGTLRSMTIRSE
jgi:predicted dehydrogenase